MKLKNYFLAILAVAGIATGCEKNEGGQEGDPKLTANPTTLEFAANGSEMAKTITVTSNREWKIVEDLDEIAWIRATVDGKSIAGEKIPASDTPVIVTITVENNTSFPREQVLTFNGGTKAKATVTVKQDGNVSYNTIREVIDAFKAQTKDSLILADMVVKATVVSNSSLDNLVSSKSLYIQDETAGINVFMTANHSFAFGDVITLNLDGVPVIKYAGVPEITNCPLDAATTMATGTVVEPIEIEASDMTSGKYEAMYVKVPDVQVVNDDLTKTWVMNSAATSIKIETKTGGSFVVRSGKYAKFGTETVAQGSGYICGICTTFNGTPQIYFAQDSDRQNMTGERFSSEKPDPSKAEAKTVAEFIALADVNTYYKLTGTVSGFNSKYCSFDLTDSTGKIYVYGLTDESKTQYSSVIKDGGTVTLSGKYAYFEKASKHEVVEAVILDYEAPQSHIVETEKISDVYAAAIGDTIILKKALVVATANTGYLVTDSDKNDYILVFQKTLGADVPVAVGDIVNVTSVKVEYNSMPQLASPATTIVSSGTEVVWPTPEDITSTFDSFTSTTIKYISFTGTLSVNGSYYNVAVNGATTNIGSMLPSSAADSWKGVPNTTFEGYYLYTASSKYIYTIYTKATPSTEPYLAVTPKSASVAAIAGSTTINVSSNVDWTVTSDNADFTVSPASGNGDGTITVTYSENTTESARVANITVATANDTALIPITQAAPGAVTYTLQFTKNSSNTAYASMFDVTVNEIGWKAPGNQGLDPDGTYGGKIKIGGKLSAATDRYLYSKSPIGGALNKITFRHGSKDSQITVNSVTISSYSTAADAESGTNAKDTQTVTYVDNDETSINVSGENWTGKYIRINYNLSSSASSSNKGIILFYVKFDY